MSRFPIQAANTAQARSRRSLHYVTYFAARKPVITPLPSDILGAALTVEAGAIQARTNAWLALEIAMESLYCATVQWEDGTRHHLTKRISLSKHSFLDIVDAFTNIKPDSSFKLVSVLFEQMAYKTNPGCQYPTTD